MENLLSEVLYWHWIVLGIALVICEAFLASFFVLWLGVAAIIIGAVLFVFPDISPTWQILGWSLLSAALAWAWFKFLKPLSIDKTKAGLAAEAIIGETGQVLSPPNGERRGTLRFPRPLLGTDEWQFIYEGEDELKAGDRVSVKSISGNSLIVKKA